MVTWAVADGDDTIVELWVAPGSSREGLAGEHGGALKVRVAAPPEGGRANRAVLALLTKLTGAPATLESGAGSRRKRVRLSGVAPAGVERSLV